MEEIYELKDASDEQQSAIQDIKTQNIIVDSVAGSGKTTLCLHIALEYSTSNILLLTYNSKLKLETRKKVNQLGIDNMEVHSYHSFCVKYYDHQCFTDSGIIQLLKKEEIKPKRRFDYDMIIVDEAQDMSPLYFELVCQIIQHNYRKFRMCIMGDKNQSIYQFNKADERYITMGNIIFENAWNQQKWKLNHLSQSFRITHEMSEFMNHCFLREDRLKSMKHNVKPRYIICDTFGESLGSSNRVYKEVKNYLKEGYTFDEIFILAPSVKNIQSPVRQLANQLSDEGIPIHVPVSDEEKLDEDILKGKIAFSTFHQVKGLERKVVIVYNMDSSYFEFFKKDSNPLVCPNEIYVACTRASEKLTLLHHYQNDYLPFVNREMIEKYSNFEKSRIHQTKNRKKKNFDTYVTDVAKHLPIEVVYECLKYFDCEEKRKPGKKIDIPIKTKQKNLYEGVSEITGIAIPNYFEFLKTGKMSIFHRCKEEIMNVETNVSTSLFSEDGGEEKKEEDDMMKLKKIDMKKLTAEELLYISNLWNSFKTGYIYKLNQIKKYDWLKEEHLKEAITRLDGLVSPKLKTEIRYEKEETKELRNRKLIGHIDCIDDKNIWEFKCVSQLENEHKIQLAIYMYMFLKENEGNKQKRSLFFDFENDRLELEDEEDPKIKEYENKLQYCEVIHLSLMESLGDKGDTIDFVSKEKEYTGWMIEEIGLEKMIVSKGDKKKKILKTDMILNHDLTRKVKKIEDEMKKLQEEIKKRKKEDYHFYLYNILDDHWIEIKSDLRRLEKMMDYLIYHKYFTKNFTSDEEFIRQNEEIRDRIIKIE